MKNFVKVIVLALCLVILLSVIPVQQSNVYAASKVAISKTTATIWVNNYVNLKISGTTSKVIWKSSNTDVAVVNASGKVVGVSTGKATITASVDEKSYESAITVKKEKDIKPLEDLVKDIKNATNMEDDSIELLGTAYYNISGYQFADLNKDGMKELLIKTYYGKLYVCSVLSGKAVLAGDFESFEEGAANMTIYVNKRTNSLVAEQKLDGEIINMSFEVNNGKLSERSSYWLRYWDYVYSTWPNDTEITKKKYETLFHTYYNPKDLTKIEFEEIELVL